MTAPNDRHGADWTKAPGDPEGVTLADIQRAAAAVKDAQGSPPRRPLIFVHPDSPIGREVAAGRMVPGDVVLTKPIAVRKRKDPTR